MKRKIICAALFILSIICCLCAACAGNTAQLAAPANLEVYGREVFWDSVENAKGYEVYFGGEISEVTECKYTLPQKTPPGNYKIEVLAYGNGITEADSEKASINFTLQKAVDHGYDEQGFEYSLLEDGSGYEISRGNAEEWLFLGTLELPDTFCGYAVKRIARSGFYYDGLLTIKKESIMDEGVLVETGFNCITSSIKLPARLETIGNSAFGNYKILQQLILPERVIEIEDGAFRWALNLHRIQFNEGLKNIGISAFSLNSLEELKLPDSLVTIGMSAFSGSGQKLYPDKSTFAELVIPANVKEIGSYAFSYCQNLQDITLLAENLTFFDYDVFSDTAWYEAQTNGLVYLRDDFLYRHKGSLTKDAVLQVPENVKYIAGGAFKSCCIGEVRMPDGVELIGTSIFNDCWATTAVSLPQDLVIIPPNTFKKSRITEITLPSTLTEIGDSAFSDCGALKQINIPLGVEKIGKYAFSDSGLTSIAILDGVTELATMLFWSCDKLSSVTIPRSVKSINNMVFEYCKKLETINYRGTIKEWQNVNKVTGWDRYTGAYVVVCTDGTLDKNGNLVNF